MPYSVRVNSYPNNEIRLTLFRDRESPFSSATEKKKGASTTLDITSKLETAKIASEVESPEALPRPGFGRLGNCYEFSIRARRQLLRAGSCLDRYPPQESVFLTGTLPGSTKLAMRAIAEWSSFLIHRVKAWIAKRCPDKLDFYVWELQKRGALHLHYVVHCADPVARQYICTNWQAEWIRLLTKVSELSGIDVFRKSANFTHASNKLVTQCKAEIVTKSVGRYLSKYTSKKASKKQTAKGVYYPVRWYGVSRPLLSQLAAATVEHTFRYHSKRDASKKFEEILHVIEAGCDRSYEYSAKFAMAKIAVGYYSSIEWGESAQHLFFEREIMKKSKTSGDFETVREQLTQSGLNLLCKYGREREWFTSVIGNRFSFLFGPPGQTVELDRYGQIDFIRSLAHALLRYRMSHDYLREEFTEWERAARASSHLMSDVDGNAIAKTSPNSTPVLEELPLKVSKWYSVQKRLF